MEDIYIGAQTRFDLNALHDRQLRSDYVRFENKLCERLPNDYLCRILCSYLSYREDHDYKAFGEEIRSLMEQQQDKEDEYEYPGRLTFRGNLVEKCRKFDFFNFENLHKRRLVNKLLTDYCKLGLSEREKVYCYENYRTIRTAIDNQYILIVDTGYNQYEYQPCRIGIDENSFFFYLAGYSRKVGTQGDFTIYSIKLCGIKSCTIRKRNTTLTGRERSEIDHRISKRGIAYIFGDQIPIKIRLSQNGYNMYLSRVHHQRPLPKRLPEKVEYQGQTCYILDFDCSYYQIRNYFFGFGNEAVILEPEISRNKFIEEYQNALDAYTEVDKNVGLETAAEK